MCWMDNRLSQSRLKRNMIFNVQIETGHVAIHSINLFDILKKVHSLEAISRWWPLQIPIS